MAIAVVYRSPSMTAEQYKASWGGSEGQPVPTPRGLMFHAGAGEGDDFFTITVWDSPEAYEEFAPVFKEVMAGMGFDFGTPAILPVHHTIDLGALPRPVETAGDLDQVESGMDLIDTNKAIATAYFEAFNERDFERGRRMRAPDCVFHGIGGHGKYESGKHAGPLPEPMSEARHADVRQEILAAWPDHRWTIEDLVAENDKVVVRLTGRSTHSGDFMGIAATGNAVIFTATFTLRIADGKIVEVRREADDLARVRQIGARILPPENQA